MPVPPRARTDQLAPGAVSELEAWFALNFVNDLGAASLLRLARRFGSPEAALSASTEELVVLGRITPEQAAQVRAVASDPAGLRARLARLARTRIRLLTISDPGYPPSLLALRTPPPLLYLKGAAKSLATRAVAIVGTRRPSASGLHLARQFAAAVARNGWTVVSGLALGVDTAGHEAVLEAGGETIAVLGCGLQRIYPPENEALARRIIRQGCLLAEAPPWAPVSRGGLLARDRIQAGLSQATVVVQAHESCGSLVTAKHALACNRPVFTVPWECEPFSAGWKKLREMGAVRVNSADDLLRSLDRLVSNPPSGKALFEGSGAGG